MIWFFLLYLFSLIGLIKGYNWPFLAIIGLSVIDISFILFSPELGFVAFFDVLLIVLSFRIYRQSKQKFTRNQWITFFSIVGLAVAGIISLFFYSSSGILIDEEIKIEKEVYWYTGWPLYEGEQLDINITVIEGWLVDVFLLDSWGYRQFEEGMSFDYYEECSDLGIKELSCSIIIPTNDEWYLIIDNTNMIEEGATTIGDVTVHVKMSYFNHNY